MDQTTKQDVAAFFEKDTWTAEDQQELIEALAGTHDAAGKFRAALAEAEAANPEPKGSDAVKIGIARYMLGQFARALDVLTNGTDNRDRRYFQGMCLKHLGEYDKAAEEFERARERGWDDLGIDLQLAGVQAPSGDIEQADKTVDKLESQVGDTAEWHYLRGLVDELSGRPAQAVDAYTRARNIDPNHGPATFRLAYVLDLHGDEERAIELYTEAVSQPPVHANALLNLAVLHEDAGQNDQAAACLRRILASNPRHVRARMFLKDVQAAKTMYYDEEQARRLARRNAVLDIPITDFELSVRARNCLKKMNVRTLGDLVRTTEAELLAYKNFGETSLKEIKEMLAAKGLRLGQALEESDGGLDEGIPDSLISEPPPPHADDALLSTPLERIDFSVRARKALESLNVQTLGDLANKTEAELLACQNFGQTSLNEVRQRLAEYGLNLRETL